MRALDRSPLPLFVLSLVLTALPAAPTSAECGDGEVISVVVLREDASVWIPELTYLEPRGPITDPSDDAIVDAINEANGTGECSQELRSDVGDHRLYWGCAWDFITASIVDERTGHVNFSGWTIWAGNGGRILPESSNHALAWLGAPPADAPADVQVIPNSLWEFVEGPGPAIDELRNTDLLHAYDDCGDYSVTAYTYTPGVIFDDAIMRENARMVLIARGKLGPFGPIAVEPSTWGRIKGRYHP
ncbi:MAG TPA: hypothetical protein VKU85_12145 [bacterium]|nr:hypothetical protein [bacterium]